MKRWLCAFTSALLLTAAAFGAEGKGIANWESDSPAMATIMSFVEEVCDESSSSYVAPSERIAVFDSDGTLYGELFPTYVDQCLMMHRFLHDDTYEGLAEDKAYNQAMEDELLRGGEEAKTDKSSGQMLAEAFAGFTVDEYRAYVRDFLDNTPVVGFEGMTYAQGYYKPMISLVEYLAEHDFHVYVVSGAETNMLRELELGYLDAWIPPYQVIGSSFSYAAQNQGDTEGRNYTLAPDELVILEGNMVFKNLKVNKVASIQERIGLVPTLAFGNSSGDFSMGTYAVQNGGKAYMLLADDAERDYGNPEKAEAFKEQCTEFGFETVSMRDEFETIYGEGVVKTFIGETEEAEEVAEEVEEVEEAAEEVAEEAEEIIEEVTEALEALEPAA